MTKSAWRRLLFGAGCILAGASCEQSTGTERGDASTQDGAVVDGSDAAQPNDGAVPGDGGQPHDAAVADAGGDGGQPHDAAVADGGLQDGGVPAAPMCSGVCSPGLVPHPRYGTCVSPDDPAYGCGTEGFAPCAIAHATPACVAGACALGACHPGWADCNDDASDGCEAELSAPSTCGSCDQQCGAGQKCAATGCVADCLPPLTDCDGRCVSIGSDPNNCGGCDMRCPASGAVTATCSGGVCGARCADGTAPQGDALCADCNTACPSTGTMRGTCLPGTNVTCAACEPGFARCGDDDTCTPLRYDEDHCGSCGRACERCEAGECAPASPTVFAESPAAIGFLLMDATHLYWSAADDVVRRVPKTGGAVETVGSNLPGISGLALDDDYVYVALDLGSGIMRVAKAGGTAEPLATATHPKLLTVDDQRVYWAEEFSQELPPDSGRYYVVVRSAPKTGGASTVIAQEEDTPSTAPRITAVVASGGFLSYNVYFGLAEGYLRRIPATGGEPVSTPCGYGGAQGQVAEDGTIYGVCSDNVVVRWVGDQVESVGRMPPGLRSLSVRDGLVFGWTNDHANPSEVRRLCLGGGESTVVYRGPLGDGQVQGDAEQVFLAIGSVIHRIPL